jgi:hypothetical protein
MNVTPSQLQAEIDRHSSYVVAVELGLLKCSKRKLKEHKQYIQDLKATLMDVTDPGENNLSDEDLLAELGL